ncbi:VOC family protein [Roseomonas gilardii]|uniref:VOC family protein n=1 Tax=Roseomonas gilardii TaxID=257708 RepID=UPI0011A57A73|nr:VOC family protein [Roseomonas gilardii]
MSDLSPTIDHVVITVGDQLDAALAQYTRLGFDMTERGHHTLGSSNHLAIFGQDYLELLGYEPGRAPQRADLHNASPGLNGLVFKPDAPDFAERLRAKGAPIGEAREFSRPVRLGEESRDARFRTASVTDPAVQNGRVFFCYHYTPELVWREEWRRHPNSVTGVAEFVIASGEPERMGDLFRRLFGADSVRETEGGLCLPAGSGTVLVLRPDAAAERFGEVPALEEGRDRMVALSLRCAAPEQVAVLLAGNGVTAVRHGARLVVPPAEAAGLALAFMD